MKLVIIGSGNVAHHLGSAFKKAGHSILQVYSRNKKAGYNLSKKLSCRFTSEIKRIHPHADVYLIAKKDDAIGAFCKKFKCRNKIVAHTSGTTGMNVLKSSSGNHGVFYPLQTFSKGRKIDLRKVPVCVEGSNPFTIKMLLRLARTVSADVPLINSGERKSLHIAAVFVNNFSNYLYIAGKNILLEKNLAFALLRPLILETAEKIQHNDPAKMQTGPAVRGDEKVIRQHLRYLSDFPQYKKIYRLISDSIKNRPIV